MKANQLIGKLEKEIMEIVWASQQQVTVREIFEAISTKKRLAYTTVMTIMGRLTDKGLLKRQKKGIVYVYQAIYSKDRFLKRICRQIINNLTANFGEGAIAHFTQELEKVPQDKRKTLVKLLKNSQ